MAVIKGGDREAPRGALVVLDASPSHDPDASFAWRVARGEVASDASDASLLLFTCASHLDTLTIYKLSSRKFARQNNVYE